MTPQEHNRVLGILHIIYGIIHVPLLALVAVLILVGLGIALTELSTLPMAALVLGGLVILLLVALFTIPPFVAGYGLLKKRPWAKMASVVSAVVELLNFPFGTALGVYSLWNSSQMESAPVDHSRTPEIPRMMSAASLSEWHSSSSNSAQGGRREERQPQYAPPAQPPDWRGE
ncbi:MAG TPA: hypothetical protein VM866_10875 [Pyrinomonadaceae bacterium]|jgi:membrane-bound ClpP family serine protease|nr:hypothetical protein [Pyrinomonadaceae bacterium]